MSIKYLFNELCSLCFFHDITVEGCQDRHHLFPGGSLLRHQPILVVSGHDTMPHGPLHGLYGVAADTAGIGQGTEITGTVSSLRADCLLSFSLHISREKAAALIRQHGISINHMMCYKADSVLKESDVFSVKGHGKYVLKSINGVSKKEKIRITLCKFI